MESEKVKEIKKALEDNANYKHHNKLGYIDGYKCKTVAFADILTLINELESENEMLKILVDIANERTYRKKFIEEWRKEYQKELDKQGKGCIAGSPDFDLVYKLYFEQKDRIAELESENERLKTQLAQANAGIVNCSGCHLVELNAVKEFAEKLKRKAFDKDMFNDWAGATYVVLVREIDKLLKEYEKCDK